ncbi:MAG: hypothetical protein IJ400_05255 [Clostridia bacterium]|nr:hypothetical protein [Clostridia bacterium]
MLIVKENGVVYIAQSLATHRNGKGLWLTKTDLTNPNNTSLFKLFRSRVIGGIYADDGNCYHAYKTIYDVRGPLSVDKIVNEVLPAIKETTELIGWDPDENDGSLNPYVYLVLARDGDAFKIHRGGAVIEIEKDCEAIGEDFLEEIICESKTELCAVERIKKAYHVAEKLQFKTKFPIAIIDTKSLKIKIYED